MDRSRTAKSISGVMCSPSDTDTQRKERTMKANKVSKMRKIHRNKEEKENKCIITGAVIAKLSKAAGRLESAGVQEMKGLK